MLSAGEKDDAERRQHHERRGAADWQRSSEQNRNDRR